MSKVDLNLEERMELLSWAKEIVETHATFLAIVFKDAEGHEMMQETALDIEHAVAHLRRIKEDKVEVHALDS